ncbi:hypothetical protein ScPMuIL_017952 [Solemya velum]
MESRTLEELATHFDTKLSGLTTSVELLNAIEDEDCQKYLLAVDSDLIELAAMIALMKNELAKQRENLRTVETLKSVILQLKEDVLYTKNNLPNRLPKVQTQQEQVPAVEQSKPVPVATSQSTNQNAVSSQQTGKGNICKAGTTEPYMPTVEYLTVEEFEAVPKYMRGRIAYNQVNMAADELSKAVRGKYKILSMKRSTLSDAKRRMYERFKMQENKETSGLYFIVEADIKDFSNLKLDGVARSIFTILRHVGRLREIRGGGVTRLVVNEYY